MTRISSLCLATGLLIASANAWATANVGTVATGDKSVVTAKVATSENTSAAAIRAQQEAIRAELGSRNGRYKDLSDSRRERLVHHQALVLGHLEGVERTTDLSEADQITVFNSLEAIEAIVNTAEDDRMICRRSKPVGSNRPTTVCRSVAQIRREKEIADKLLERDQQ